MLHSHAPSGAVCGPSGPRFTHGSTALEALRLDARLIHDRLRRIADLAACGGTPAVDELDGVASAVHALHLRILDITRDDASMSLADVDAARLSIRRSLALVHEVAEDVLSS